MGWFGLMNLFCTFSLNLWTKGNLTTLLNVNYHTAIVCVFLLESMNKVARSRLRPAQEPPWVPVYLGTEIEFGVVGVVPEMIAEKERGYEPLVCFTLQTIGVDYPDGVLGLMGPVALCFMHNPLSIEPKAMRRGKQIIEVDSMILESWHSSYWAEGISNCYW